VVEFVVYESHAVCKVLDDRVQRDVCRHVGFLEPVVEIDVVGEMGELVIFLGDEDFDKDFEGQAGGCFGVCLEGCARGCEEGAAEERIVAWKVRAPDFANALAAQEVVYVEGAEDGLENLWWNIGAGSLGCLLESLTGRTVMTVAWRRAVTLSK
jgi:hypothetical protein